MTRKLVVEAIGTFFLVFTIGQVSLAPGAAGALGPWAIAAVLMVMVYAGSHVSGAHYNPAVTLAVFIRGKAQLHELIGYWVFQAVAAAVAGMLVLWIKGGGPLTVPSMDLGRALTAEFVFTFALAYVVLNVAAARGVAGNSYYGLAIGSTVLAGAYAVGGLSGGHFNPAVSIGALVMGMVTPLEALVFFLPQFAGAAAAALLFRALDLDNDKPTTATEEEQAGLRSQVQPQ